MTWYDAIRELCLQVDHEETVKDILATAVDECMITPRDAISIAQMAHCEIKPRITTGCPYGVNRPDCMGSTGPWCGYCRAENG